MESASSPENWKDRGGEAYKRGEWAEAARCYGLAVESLGLGLGATRTPASPLDATSGPAQPAQGGQQGVGASTGSGSERGLGHHVSELGLELGLVCLNNRAACFAQLGDHAGVVRDTSAVLRRQPANLKALFRRMLALDALKQVDAALEDAAAVLTLEPKNAQARELVARKRSSLTKKPTEGLPRAAALRTLCVFLFSEDAPLRCYGCLRSLRRLKGAALNVHVFWRAEEPACRESYRFLQALPETSRLPQGRVTWVDASGGQLFSSFSRAVNRLSVEGQQHLLLLSDAVLFHTDISMSGALDVLSERSEAFAVRLDVNPRIDYFPDEGLISSSPPLQHFSKDPTLLLWTRWYDKSKMAYEAVPREAGWDAILDWTASLVRVEHIQHFFSALLPPLENVKELDQKAADWLSRRQRMKRSEVSPRSACYDFPILVTLDPEAFGPPASADHLLRAHLARRLGVAGGACGTEASGSRCSELAAQLGWRPAAVSEYFGSAAGALDSDARLEGLLRPDGYRGVYLNTVRAPALLPAATMPVPLRPPGPLVSWLVPTRNAENYIRDCLASIESQQGIDAGCYEVVFVDDGSEDATLAVLRRLASERPHLRVVETSTRRGVGGALREGWRQCRGDFVARLDADDEAEPERLLRQLRHLARHEPLALLGGRTRSFWTEHRKCTVERVSERVSERGSEREGLVSVVVWREFHGNQTSRQREQITLCQRGAEVLLTEGPAEYHGCRVVRIGDTCLALQPEKWREALRAAQGGQEMLLQRRDPLEPPKGSRALHPLLVRATLLFEECVSGTTMMLRKASFPEEGPFQEEDAEGQWCLLSLGTLHAANLADTLVRTRRHEANYAQSNSSGIYDSRCAAVQHHLTRVHGVDVDLNDAAALWNFRGPRTAEQGAKLLDVLTCVERSYFAEFTRPRGDERGPFWTEFVQGREAALERAIVELRTRFKGLADEVAAVITSVPEHSPRERRSRTPPR